MLTIMLEALLGNLQIENGPVAIQFTAVNRLKAYYCEVILIPLIDEMMIESGLIEEEQKCAAKRLFQMYIHIIV